MKTNLYRIKNALRRQKREAIETLAGTGKKKYEDAEPQDVSSEQILQDMRNLQPRFDLREDKWHTKEGSDDFLKEFFDPSKNYTTDDIRVPEVFRQWLMGQKAALRKLDLIVAEWYKQIFKVQKLEDDEAKGIVQSKVLK